ncbi:hypothetical protein [Nocardia bhagyanarayanae]|uniref:TAP-like protein n=1 Tax=Nocardia bhagyanarayanae TaxID=1215925 RepID=A0A543EV34_9NOCA|nr:hypothetical protein [Nocardia bhagyanarayanae]TQM25437.1 hypothetical protein FB390_5586 [Nocardia bhagyanarayanae]
MRKHLRAGMLAGALLLAPLAGVVPASAIPLEPAEPASQSEQVANPGCPGGAPHWDCLLSSLSASGSAK